jgi:hypothetical protein
MGGGCPEARMCGMVDGKKDKKKNGIMTFEA